MSYSVTATDLTHIRFNETDTVASVLQNIAVILRSRRGTVPLYRDFGLAGSFLDKPVPAAKALIFREIKEAVERFEPRAEVVNITFAEDQNTPGRLLPTVEVDIHE